MRRTPPSLVFVAVLCAATLGSTSVGAATKVTTSSSASGPVRIGLEAPLSGDQRNVGVGMLNGVRLSARRINAAGGVGGRQVVIVPIDDAADPATGVTAATAAIASGLDGVVGPYNSGVGVRTLPIYQAAGIVPVRLTSAPATAGFGVTLQAMTYQIAPVAAKAITTWKHARSVAIVFDNSTVYTQSVAQALHDDLTAAGVTVNASLPIQPGATDYSSVVDQAVAGSPDLVYLAVYYPEGALLAQEMLAKKVSAACLADHASYDLQFIAEAGARAAALCPVVGEAAPQDFPGSAKYVTAYRRAFKAAPGAWTPYAYDSLSILIAAAEKAGSFDPAVLIPTLGSIPFSGWTGKVTIQAGTGDRVPAAVAVLRPEGRIYTVDRSWAKAVGAEF